MKKTVTSPSDLFFDQMKDIHSMEFQISEHLPDLIVKATDDRLRALLLNHSYETDQQLTTIRELFAHYGKDPGSDKCKAISGLVEGGNSHLSSVDDNATRDLMLIAHCLRVQRYEIAAYEITSRLAGQLGLVKEAGILLRLLVQEQSTADSLLGLEPNLFEKSSHSA